MVAARIKTTYYGKVWKINKPFLTAVLLEAMKKACAVTKNAAIHDYYKKKQAEPKTPSFIIDSFTFEIPYVGNSQVIGIVYAGGPTAPWTPFVDEGHTYRDGTKFGGYHFMRAGAIEGNKRSPDIIKAELKKFM